MNIINAHHRQTTDDVSDLVLLLMLLLLLLLAAQPVFANVATCAQGNISSTCFVCLHSLKWPGQLWLLLLLQMKFDSNCLCCLRRNKPYDCTTTTTTNFGCEF